MYFGLVLKACMAARQVAVPALGPALVIPWVLSGPSEPGFSPAAGLQCPREPGAGVQERGGLVWGGRQAGPQLRDGPRHPDDQQAP